MKQRFTVFATISIVWLIAIGMLHGQSPQDLFNRGAMASNQGNPRQALQYYIEGIQATIPLYGEDNFWQARPTIYMAGSYGALRDPVNAYKVAKEGVALYQNNRNVGISEQGPEAYSAELIWALSKLIGYAEAAGAGEDADRAIKLAEAELKHLPPGGFRGSRFSLKLAAAGFLQQQGMLKESLQSFQEAAEILRVHRNSGPEDQIPMNRINWIDERNMYFGMGLTQAEMSRLPDAIASMNAARDLYEVRGITTGPGYADVLANLATFYLKTGREEEAGQLLSMVEGIDSGSMAATHNEILNLTISGGANIEDSLDRLMEVESTIRAKFGKDHPDLAYNLTNQMAVLWAMAAKADGPEQTWLARQAVSAGEEAWRIRKLQLGDDVLLHRGSWEVQAGLAIARQLCGDRQGALETVRTSRMILENLLHSLDRSGSTREKLAFREGMSFLGGTMCLGYPDEIEALSRTWKLRVTNSLMRQAKLNQEVAASDQYDMEELQAVFSLNERYHAIVMQNGAASSDAQSLAEEIDRREREFGPLLDYYQANQVPAQPLRVPSGTVIVDFHRYANIRPGQSLTDWYGGLVINSQGDKQWIPCSPAARIDSLVEELSEIMNKARPSDDQVQVVLNSLHDELWAPLVKDSSSLRNAAKVVVIPDGQLAVAPFDLFMPDAHTFLGQKQTFRQAPSLASLSAGASLMLPSRPSAVLIGDPQFHDHSIRKRLEAGIQRDPEVQQRMTPDFLGWFQSLSRLPGTRVEINEMSKLAQESGWGLQVFTDVSATETALRSVQSPSILHIASHGLFLAQETELSASVSFLPSSDQERDAGMSMDGIYRSSITLAGAGETLTFWKAGEVPDPLHDGILNAAEAAGLSLSDTWLVTLSACKTGYGEVLDGEGLVGLRQGFFIAGADNILLTLWEVYDEHEIIDFIVDLYQRVQNGGPLDEALQEAKFKALDWIIPRKGLGYALKVCGGQTLVSTALQSD